MVACNGLLSSLHTSIIIIITIITIPQNNALARHPKLQSTHNPNRLIPTQDILIAIRSNDLRQQAAGMMTRKIPIISPCVYSGAAPFAEPLHP
ncbi:hypothetical protein EYC80_010086 [Monilinia laxa]|uniref:Uncharacterized protein n=1 Tax=Monilinia laxa TaxID=61186 RepID=A0A5N6JT14_MONLA|nr:hypothetical protein EYC80_010086 [Monilinia laxa]